MAAFQVAAPSQVPLFCFFLFFFISGQNVCREKASFNVLYAKAHAHTKKANLILFKINKIFIHKKWSAGHVLLCFFFAQESLHQIWSTDNWSKLVKQDAGGYDVYFCI